MFKVVNIIPLWGVVFIKHGIRVIHLTWYQSYTLNLVMSIDVEQRTPKEKGVEAPQRHSKK